MGPSDSLAMVREIGTSCESKEENKKYTILVDETRRNETRETRRPRDPARRSEIKSFTRRSTLQVARGMVRLVCMYSSAGREKKPSSSFSSSRAGAWSIQTMRAPPNPRRLLHTRMRRRLGRGQKKKTGDLEICDRTRAAGSSCCAAALYLYKYYSVGGRDVGRPNPSSTSYYVWKTKRGVCKPLRRLRTNAGETRRGVFKGFNPTRPMG